MLYTPQTVTMTSQNSLNVTKTNVDPSETPHHVPPPGSRLQTVCRSKVKP